MSRPSQTPPRPPAQSSGDVAADGPRVAGLVLAAGAARRFGAAKQLAPLDGRPLLEHALAAMAAAGLPRFAVALGARAGEIAAAVDLHGAELIAVPGWEEGLAASLRAGVAALAPHADAIVVTLGDQPRVGVEAIRRVAAAGSRAWVADAASRTDEAGTASTASSAPAARATYDGRPGHPVLLRRELFGAVAGLRGDGGARELLATVAVEPIPCPGDPPRDVDTPADLRALAPPSSR